ncbi:Zona occludens toxin [Paracidovorax anthurii]|uniref:Zona occludens toxin n=1 Tax=Paracidovorax anthurii TaxID=78229 RepID=A0A328ZTL4_9BURK|nr:zona occludens toxin [Paracidovorax anthurii]
MRRVRSLRRQLGFLYLSTGANGAGKTLFTLLDVRALQLETSRPVFFSGFTAKQPLFDFGWQEFAPELWQDCPDGSILIIDECHLKLPLRGAGKPPEWIEMIPVTHRKRGMDIYFITQHPMNMDAFIRRVIASPGWHRHFKASFMGDSSNELRWTSVNDQPQKPGSGKSGEIKSRPFPKEVYAWYESASLHTAKKGIPAKVWWAVGALLAAIASVIAVVWILTAQASGAVGERSTLVKQAEQAGGVSAASSAQRAVSGTGGAGGGSSRGQSMTKAEYLDQRVPRIEGFPHTAGVYDGVTAPTDAPYPAACMSMGKACKCYTQQATLMQVPADVCRQIVAHGYFVDWRKQDPPMARVDQAALASPTPAPQSVVINMPVQAPPHAQQRPGWAESLALRNSQVRGTYER